MGRRVLARRWGGGSSSSVGEGGVRGTAEYGRLLRRVAPPEIPNTVEKCYILSVSQRSPGLGVMH